MIAIWQASYDYYLYPSEVPGIMAGYGGVWVPSSWVPNTDFMVVTEISPHDDNGEWGITTVSSYLWSTQYGMSLYYWQTSGPIEPVGQGGWTPTGVHDEELNVNGAGHTPP